MSDALDPVYTGTVLVAHPGAEKYGSDRVLLESVGALVDRDWRVVLTTPTTGPLHADAVRRGASVTVQPTAILRKSSMSPMGLVRLAGEAVSGFFSARRLMGELRPDLVYVSTVTIPVWALAARSRGIPVATHVHEAERSARPVLRRALALPLALSQRILVNSGFSRDVLLADAPALAARTSVVYNGVASPPSGATAPRAELTDSTRLVYVGRLSPRKGVDVAIAAATELARRGVPVSLRVVGAVFTGYEWYAEELERLASDAREAGAHVEFAGFEDSPWSALDRSDIALIPSRTDEPFGNTAVEAVLAARPAVVSRSGGLPEAVDGFPSARLIAPDSVTALVDAVVAIRDDWERVSSAAVTDAERASVRFGVGTYAEILADSLERLAMRRDDRPHHPSEPTLTPKAAQS